jgi:hypothetical protein
MINFRDEQETIMLDTLQQRTLAEVEQYRRKQKATLQLLTNNVNAAIVRDDVLFIKLTFFLQHDSKNWVTSENLLAKIEEALDNPQSFDFAVTAEGGRVETPTPTTYLERVPAMNRLMYEQSYVTRDEAVGQSKPKTIKEVQAEASEGNKNLSVVNDVKRIIEKLVPPANK